jgi:formyltetrahydrofolate-dependent phosphoribosylglycinamide formyltransferase
MSMRVAVCVSGGGSNLVALLEEFGAGPDVEIVLVISNRPSAGGLERARERGIPAIVLRDPADEIEWIALLERHQVQLIVLAGYLRLVPRAVIQRWQGRILNIHPGPLPDFGGHGMYGLRVHAAVLASGRKESAATVHLVDEEYDRGPVLASAPVPVRPGDTPETLAARVLKAEHRLLPAVVRAAARAGHPVALPEPSEQA